MTHFLIPRLTTQQARQRFSELENRLNSGLDVDAPFQPSREIAAPNPNGGQAAKDSDLARWRAGVLAMMATIDPATKTGRDRHAIELGKAIATHIDPSPSDAAHDGGWSFLSLYLLPEVLAARWPPLADGRLPGDRWVGAQLGRDRNYLKWAWRRWKLLGDLQEHARSPLGEDELLNLFERSAVARNQRLIHAVAREILGHEGEKRMEFTRALMRQVTQQTGPLMLDILSDGELTDLISGIANSIHADRVPAGPKRATPDDDLPTNDPPRRIDNSPIAGVS